MTEVTDADRALIQALERFIFVANDGGFMSDDALDALARHRIAAEARGEQRAQEGVVAWLRNCPPDHSDEGGCPFDKAASAIERGEWRGK